MERLHAGTGEKGLMKKTQLTAYSVPAEESNPENHTQRTISGQ
jgi:hypothetical protein